jgi:hypothetical protein
MPTLHIVIFIKISSAISQKSKKAFNPFTEIEGLHLPFRSLNQCVAEVLRPSVANAEMNNETLDATCNRLQGHALLIPFLTFTPIKLGRNFFSYPFFEVLNFDVCRMSVRGNHDTNYEISTTSSSSTFANYCRMSPRSPS